MKFIPVKVESYSGYKADEYPKNFCWNNKWFEIEEITDRWYQGDHNAEWPVSDYFRLVTTCGAQYIIKHDLKSDEWYLGQ